MKGKREVLTISQILDWADLHHLRTGRWPTSRSGPIIDRPERTWESVQTALVKGTCGLPGGSTLARLLRSRRKAKDPRLTMPDLDLKKVLEWVDAHWSRTGQWPHRDGGAVAECPSIAWATIDRRLKQGRLSLPKGTTLSKWLREVRGVWDGGKPRLTEKLVLRWAEEHHSRYGRWPVTLSGPLLNNPDENWAAIDVALRNGRRGFPYRTSLSQLLTRHHGDRYTRFRNHTGPKSKRANVRFVRVRKPAVARRRTAKA
jgi:hypothetical protein